MQSCSPLYCTHRDYAKDANTTKLRVASRHQLETSLRLKIVKFLGGIRGGVVCSQWLFVLSRVEEAGIASAGGEPEACGGGVEGRLEVVRGRESAAR